jgi:hypothetical protein
MKLFNKVKYLIFVLLFGFKLSSTAQEYILFEKHKGINSKEVSAGLMLAQNNIELKVGDTSLTIFNFYYTPQYTTVFDNLGKKIPALLDEVKNKILVSAVPLIKPGEQLQLKKLSESEFNQLNIINNNQLFERSVIDLNKHFYPRKYSMPALKTLQYQLIIKEGANFYLVIQPTLVSQFILGASLWFFPNEFINGVLNTNPAVKMYQFKDIEVIEKELMSNKDRTILFPKITNKIYVSGIDEKSGFKRPVFSYWEYHDGGVESTLFNIPKLHEANLGLGSFSFLQDIGIINCTLDAYLKRKILYNQKQTFNIISINGQSLEQFKETYKNSLPKSSGLIFGGH